MVGAPASVADPRAAGVSEPSLPEVSGRRKRSVSGRVLEGFAIFALFAAVYFLVGYEIVVKLHVVNFDALSRLSHAYFVWFNDPQKLAAIGFVWPPIQTLIYLPFAAVAPLATSLAAIPATSAFFMAGTLVLINFSFRACEMPWYGRYPLLLGFGFNPMILYYATNGMAEAVYLFFLTMSVYFLMRWHQTSGTHLLAFVGLGMAFAALSRYEMVPYAVVIAAIIVILTWRKNRKGGDLRSLESALVLFGAPVVYFGVAWLFFNWLILGDPFYFMTFGAASADVSTSNLAMAGTAAPELGIASLAVFLVKLNFALFPLTIVVVLGLIATGLIRRDMFSLLLVLLACTNALVTFLLYAGSEDANLLQLRYNMRAMPVVLIGIGWIYNRWRPSRVGGVAVLVCTVVLGASMVMTWRTMETYSTQYQENVFLRALETREDQQGNVGIAGYQIGLRGETGMAEYLQQNLEAEDTVLTDDGQTFAVMLLSGFPDRFLDRIDRGDNYWDTRLENPFGRVEYFLTSTNRRCRAPFCEDRVRIRYPGILKGDEPGMTVVHQEAGYALIRIAERRPVAGPDPGPGSQP